MTTSTRTDEAFILVMLRKGRGLDFIVNSSGWAEADVIALAEREEINVVRDDTAPTSAVPTASGNGHAPTPAAMPRTPAPLNARPLEDVRPGDVPELIRLGRSHKLKSIRSAAERARMAYTKLDEAFRRESGKAQARAEVERLEAELAAAKVRLRGKPAATGGSSAPAQSDAAKIPYAEVRAWARENNVDCPAKGRVPDALIEQWRAATA